MTIKQPSIITPEELKNIKDLQSEINNVTFQLGQLHFSKIKLEEQENLIKIQLSELEKKEAKIANNLTENYGKGSLNIETGEFTPL